MLRTEQFSWRSLEDDHAADGTPLFWRLRVAASGYTKGQYSTEGLAKLLASCAPQSVTREMDTVLDRSRHFLAFERMRTSLSLPLIYKTSMEEA